MDEPVSWVDESGTVHHGGFFGAAWPCYQDELPKDWMVIQVAPYARGRAHFVLKHIDLINPSAYDIERCPDFGDETTEADAVLLCTFGRGEK